MGITNFRANRFRNMTSVNVSLDSKLNFFLGQNASGKTSLLEAVYYLGRAKSFRTRDADNIIQHNETSFQLFAQIDGPTPSRIGLERSAKKINVLKNSRPLKALSLLAETLPVLFISTENQRLLLDGPAYRRSMLDWGLFHTKAGYAENYKRYARALSNRNAALKNSLQNDQIALWHPELALQAAIITSARNSHLDAIVRQMRKIYTDVCDDFEFQYRFVPGWKEQENLADQLMRQIDKDRRYGVTSSGPHRDDFRIEVGKKEASVVLSRGQQKRFNIAFVLAQKDVIAQASQRPVVTLIDDLSSELDTDGFYRIINLLESSADQYLITLIDSGQQPFSELPGRMFHVEHGKIAQQISST